LGGKAQPASLFSTKPTSDPTVEDAAVDFVVVGHEAETFLHAGDQRDDGHRVEFGKRAEQRRVGAETAGSPLEAENFVEQTKD